MKTRTYEVKIKGLTPLLMHQNNLEARDEATAKGKTGGKKADDRYPADKWKEYLYVANGAVVMPSENVIASLLKVGYQISIGGKKTLKSSTQNIMFREFYLPFYCQNQKLDATVIDNIDGEFKDHVSATSKLGFNLFVKACRIQKASHVRVRPRFDVWEVRGTFDTDDEELTTSRLQDLFRMAGTKQGLCDWRPGSSTPGPYGKYLAEVTEIK